MGAVAIRMTGNHEARRLVRQRLFEHGATLSTAVLGGREHLTAWLPNGTGDDVLDEAKRDGWVVVLCKPLGWHLVNPPESREGERKRRGWHMRYRPSWQLGERVSGLLALVAGHDSWAFGGVGIRELD